MLLEALRDGLGRTDLSGRIQEFNEAFRAMLGYERSELLELTYLDLTPEKWHAFEMAIVREQVMTRGYSDVYEKEYLRADGSILPVELRTVLDRDEGGVPTGMWAVVRDITERKRAEEALRKSEEVLRYIIKYDPNAIAVYDRDLNYVAVSDRYLNDYGVASQDVLGKHHYEVFPEMPQRWKDVHRRVLAGAIEQEEDDSFERPDGSVTYNRWECRPWYEPDGSIAGMISYTEVTTERKRAEHALRESEERYRQLVEWANDWIWEVDQHARYVFTSPKVVELLGYEPAEVLGKTPFDFMPPDEAERIEAAFSAIAAKREAFRDLPNVNVHKAGHLVFLEASGVPVFDAGGNYRGYRGVDRNVSERKRLEEARAESERVLATLMANLPGIAYRCLNDHEWTQLFLSEGCETLTGYRVAEVLGNARVSYADLIHPDDREMVWKEIQASVSTKEPFRLVYRITTADGETKWVWEQGRGVFDDDGRLLYLEGFVTDISERIAAEEALRTAEEQLRHSQKMEAIGQLAGGIAHDFNNLLTAIIGYCDLILTRPVAEDLSLRNDIGEIRRAGERASSLTRQILAFSRRQTLRPRVVSLNEVLVGMEPLLRRTLGEDIELVSLKHSELGMVEVDVHQFEQVLMNLAVNARDAMPAGGQLTLEIANVELGEDYCSNHPDAEPGSYVMLSVSDTGEGMAQETMAHMFEPFFTTKDQGRGTGLGLSTVYGIVRQSGGSIDVHSEPGQGSSFKVYLPRVASLERRAAPVMSPGSSVHGHETILVVEDEEALRRMMARILGDLGYRVFTAGTADEALAVVAESDSNFDLLLTDIVLPGGIQGNDLARSLLNSRPNLPVLYMSGYTRTAIVHAGRLDEGVYYLEKPFTPDSLARRVREVLDNQTTAP